MATLTMGGRGTVKWVVCSEQVTSLRKWLLSWILRMSKKLASPYMKTGLGEHWLFPYNLATRLFWKLVWIVEMIVEADCLTMPLILCWYIVDTQEISGWLLWLECVLQTSCLGNLISESHADGIWHWTGWEVILLWSFAPLQKSEARGLHPPS